MEIDSNWVDWEQTQTLENSADVAVSVERTLEYTKEICKDLNKLQLGLNKISTKKTVTLYQSLNNFKRFRLTPSGKNFKLYVYMVLSLEDCFHTTTKIHTKYQFNHNRWHGLLGASIPVSSVMAVTEDLSSPREGERRKGQRKLVCMRIFFKHNIIIL